MPSPPGMFVLDTRAAELIYGPPQRQAIESAVQLLHPSPLSPTAALREYRDVLAQAEVVFSGWGGPQLTEEFLDAAPALKVVFYGAGAVAQVVTDSSWDRGVKITSAYAANAIPVAQYALATLLFSLKHGFALARQTRQTRSFPPRDGAPGCYQATVGLISLGMIGRTLLKYLAPFEFKVLAYDPMLTAREAQELGVERASLEELFRRSDAVSIHTPCLPETEGLITGAHLASMKHGAAFINTARGSIVREHEMIEVLSRRRDLQAVLDVAAGEPPPKDSPLYSLPNVTLTPHIAGSVGNECRRMGQLMVEELGRYVTGEPLKWEVTRDLAEHSCHRPVSRPREADEPKLTVKVRARSKPIRMTGDTAVR